MGRGSGRGRGRMGMGGGFSGPGMMAGPGAKLDANGNMQRGQLQQILSQAGTELTAGHSRTLTTGRDRASKGKRRRAMGKAGGQYVARPLCGHRAADDAAVGAGYFARGPMGLHLRPKALWLACHAQSTFQNKAW